MKKILALLLVLTMVLGLCACGSSSAPATEPAKTEPQAPAVTDVATEETVPAEKAPEDYTGKLVVYSPHDADPLNAGVAQFEEKYPNIDVEVIAAGTGELCQRIVAEAANPQGDVLWGGGADTLAAYTDYFQPYVCANDEFIGDAYKDPNGYWIGESPLPMVFIYNKTLIDEADVPTTWEGLCNENLKGKIAYASPSKSGSAYTQLCTMLFSQPTIEDGWALVEKFIANLDGKLQDSSGNCHKLVASGEYALGVTIEKSAVLYADNPDIGFVYPENNSAVPDGVALIKDCPNEENAKLFIDFVTSAECQTAQNADWARRPVRSDITPKDLCSLDECNVGKYDFDYAASNRDAIKEQFNDLVAG
ncbi:MAG: ABC transporter substrate-binding protein [Firmicutes bacterium]|nr:ABC transporter substrate-binding protein [Bacillota bacterium]